MFWCSSHIKNKSVVTFCSRLRVNLCCHHLPRTRLLCIKASRTDCPVYRIKIYLRKQMFTDQRVTIIQFPVWVLKCHVFRFQKEIWAIWMDKSLWWYDWSRCKHEIMLCYAFVDMLENKETRNRLFHNFRTLCNANIKVNNKKDTSKRVEGVRGGQNRTPCLTFFISRLPHLREETFKELFKFTLLKMLWSHKKFMTSLPLRWRKSQQTHTSVFAQMIWMHHRRKMEAAWVSSHVTY